MALRRAVVRSIPRIPNVWPSSGMQVLLQFGRPRHPAFRDIPTARELAKTDAARALIELVEAPYALSRPFAAPPGIPKDRASALQAAFLRAHQDPQFLDEATRLKIDVSPIGGEAALDAVTTIARAPAEVINHIKKLLAAQKGG